ncbi:MAG: choice-of-anchor B family protein [Candidatus Arcticimaribacter sp.]
MKKVFSSLYLIVFLLVGCIPLDDDSTIDIPEVIVPETPTPTPQGQPIPIITAEVTQCENGFAGQYPCSNYNLINWVSLPSLGSVFANDNWGWTDPETGKEYVLQGLKNGVAFLDISDPAAIRYIGKLPTASDESTWRDIKVYRNHAYIVSEAAAHGLQVFDLTRLRNQIEFQTFTADAVLNTFSSAHNIAINEDSGFAYVVGARKNSAAYYSGGPVFIDINTPAMPQEIGGYGGSSYTHDAHIVTYQGPDPDHQGREILFGSNSDGGENNKVIVVDVTNKTNPRLISETTYGNGGYTHQGWVDPDQRFFYLGDELDEIRYGNNTRTLVFDMSDLDNPVLNYTYDGVTAAIDHNAYVKDNSLFISNYTAGFREIDVSGIIEGQMQEVGFFDTYPANNNASFDGVWNVYPFFDSGLIAISDSNRGLFLVQKSN